MKLIDKPEETLYRAIRPLDFLWDFDFDRPSSAAFKDKDGLSCDKLDDRQENEVFKTLRKRFETRAIVKIKVKQCLKIGVYPKDAPSKQNKYHAEIWENEHEKLISSQKRRLLADRVEICD